MIAPSATNENPVFQGGELAAVGGQRLRHAAKGVPVPPLGGGVRLRPVVGSAGSAGTPPNVGHGPGGP